MVSSKCWEKTIGNQELCGLKNNISKQSWNKNVLGQEKPNLHNIPTPNTFLSYFYIVLVLPYINMNMPQVYMCSPSWTLLPPCTIPLGRPSAPAPSIQYMHRTWTGDLFHIWYYTYFNAILPNHPTLSLSHKVQKTVLYISVYFAVSYTGLLLPSF